MLMTRITPLPPLSIPPLLEVCKLSSIFYERFYTHTHTHTHTQSMFGTVGLNPLNEKACSGAPSLYIH
jgi:hypothetical protein